MGVREKDVFRIRRKFGVLFQDGALFGSMSLFDDIAFPLREHTNKTEREIKGIVLRKAELVGLVDHLAKLPGEVSGGMRKRAGLARAPALEPEIILFAEYMGLLFRSRLVASGSKADMASSEDPIVRQFLAGQAEGPIGMDEMAEGDAPRTCSIFGEEADDTVRPVAAGARSRAPPPPAPLFSSFPSPAPRSCTLPPRPPSSPLRRPGPWSADLPGMPPRLVALHPP